MGKQRALITPTQRAAIYYRNSSRILHKPKKKLTRKKKAWDALLKREFNMLHAFDVEKKNTAFCNDAIAAEDQYNRNRGLNLSDTVPFKHDVQVSREVGFTVEEFTQDFSKLSISDSVRPILEHFKYSVDQVQSERTCNSTGNKIEDKKEDEACKASHKEKRELGLSDDLTKLHALTNPMVNQELPRNIVVIDEQSLRTLESPEWINDSVINSFLELIADDKHVVFRVQVWNQDWDQADVVLSNFNWIFMPIYIPNHWILLVAHIPTMSACVLDSSLNNDNGKYITKFWNHMKNSDLGGNWSKMELCSCLQTDNHNCGAFVMLNAYPISKGVNPEVLEHKN